MGKHLQNPSVEAASMGGFKITNLAAGSAATDAVNFGQLASAGSKWTAAGTDIYRLSRVGINTPAPAYSFHVIGQSYLDASTLTGTSPFTAFIIKAKTTAASTIFLEAQDDAGVWASRHFVTSTEIQARANARDYRIIGNARAILDCGTGFLIVHSAGYTQFSGVATDPTATSGALWINTTESRFKYQVGTNIRSFANKEDDLVGLSALIASATHTPSGTTRTIRYDALNNAITVTLGPLLDEGYDYCIRCTRNTINAITFLSDTGHVLAVSGVSTLFPTSTIAVAHQIYWVRRHGTVIYIK